MKLLHLLVLGAMSSGSVLATCTTDEDCSLNGICTTASKPVNTTTMECQCDPGWTGDDCGHLDLSPARKNTGFNYTTYNDTAFYGPYGNSSWGGQIIQDNKDPRTFHLIADMFGQGCGLSGWRPSSVIIRAESTTGPQGPFVYKETIKGSFRHNAYVFWSPYDQKYLLYAIGTNASHADTGKCQSITYKQWPNNISVSSAASIRGPWTDFKMVLDSRPPENPQSTNPAPWPLWTPENPVSDIILGVEDDAIFQAKTFDGNYTLTHAQAWNTSELSPTWTEDTFLWRDKRGNWHILSHWLVDLVEKNSQQWPRVAAHQFSRNLTGPWTFKLQEAFNSTVKYTDGSVQTFRRRERPKLYFSDDGLMTPLYLITGVQAMNSSGSSYTHVQPIGTKWKDYEDQFGF